MTLSVRPNAPTAPFVPWEQFWQSFTTGEDRWLQGEHVALIGMNGCGKTTLAYHLLPLRKYVTVLATKPRDPSLKRFADGLKFHQMKTWEPDLPARNVPKRLVWPPITDLRHRPAQREVMINSLYDIYGQGSWCVYIDELYYLTQDLGLGRIVKTYLLQSRSNDISLVLATQRPAWVPLETYSQATHLFFWRTRDRRDLDRIDGIASHDAEIVREAVRELNFKQHEFLYVNQRSGTLLRSAAPAPSARKEGK